MKKNSLFFVFGLSALLLMVLIFLFFRWFNEIDFLEGIDSYTYQNTDYGFSLEFPNESWHLVTGLDALEETLGAVAEFSWERYETEAFIRVVITREAPFQLGIAGLSPLGQSDDYFFSYYGSQVQTYCAELSDTLERESCEQLNQIWEEEVEAFILPSFQNIENESAKAALCPTVTTSPNLLKGDVLALAKQASAQAYAFTQDQGAELIPVDDGKSYVVWWEPENFNMEEGTVVVSLHGHGDWAVKDFEVWYPELAGREYAYLGVQWWFGRSLENEGYYEPDQIYAIIADMLEEKGVPSGNVLFQGFSMGGARSYGITLYDKLCGESYFGVSIANSGPWEDDYPLYAEILDGEYGKKPFEGTHWILFCGEKDYNEKGDHPGYFCDGMRQTEETLTDLGATIDLFIADPNGDHGSFMIDPLNRTEGLDAADEVLGTL